MTDYSSLPEHMRAGVKRYIEHGKPGGNFLTEVFSNRLVQAFGRADQDNIHAMKDWASFLYNEAPSRCWGSPAKVDQWIKHKGLEGLDAYLDTVYS